MNHNHLEVAKGKFKQCYTRNSYGVWQLPNSMDPDKAFVVDGCVLYNNGQPSASGKAMKWIKADQIPGITKEIKVGWAKSGNEWKYVTKAGTYAKGWLEIDKAWYYFNKSGNAVKGWNEIKYMGKLHWFYFDSNCRMLSKKWVENKDKWYYLKSSGAMACSEWIQDKGKWYYLKSSGAMAKNEWLNLSGKDYYVNGRGEMLTGKQKINGKEYIFNQKGHLESSTQATKPEKSDTNFKFGVDISAHNGADFDVTPYDFVIIRASWGTNEDTLYWTYADKCEAAGIPYGVYVYSYALDNEGAQAEADFVLDLIKDRNITCGVWFDMEDADGYKERNGKLTREVCTGACETFCSAIEAAGYYTGVYCNPDFLNRFVTHRFPQWLAYWTGEADQKEACVLHQYQGDPLDLDVMYADLETFANPGKKCCGCKNCKCK